jgi:2-polyprenyl-6-methoxyphenol hydroxylase-like FAD-dependent oxidoreductase
MATAVALRSRGIASVRIYEKAQALRPVGAAIGLYPNGLAALQYISPSILASHILPNAIPSRLFERRDLNDTLLQVTNVDKTNNNNNSSSLERRTIISPIFYVWYRLQQHLADALPPEVVRLGHSLESFEVLPNNRNINDDSHNHLVRVCVTSSMAGTSSSSCKYATCRVLIGADGIQSTVRTQLFGSKRPLYYHGKVMYRAVIPTTTNHTSNNYDLDYYPPAGTQVSYQSDEAGKSFSIRETIPGLLTLTAAALAPYPTNRTTATEKKEVQKKKDRLKHLFQGYPERVQRIIHDLDPEAIHETHVRDMNVEEEWSRGPVVLIGDAAHAMTPHMGQGANQGLEDVCELVHRLVPELQTNQNNNENHIDTLSNALYLFWNKRIERVKEVHARSRQNSLQSNTFDKTSASVPFQRRNYSASFQDRLYNWKPPTALEDKAE